MIKEFWVKCIRNSSPAKLAESVRDSIPDNVQYIPYEEFLLSEYKQVFDPKDAPEDKAVLVEWTKFPKRYEKGVGICLTYLLVCPRKAIGYTTNSLDVAGFEASDCPF